MPKEKQRLLPEWFEHPVFFRRFEQMFEASDFYSLGLLEQSILLKSLIRDAAIRARDAIFESGPLDNHAMLCRLSSIARAVFSGDARLASIIQENAEFAKDHLSWNSEGAPTLIDPVAFDEAVRVAEPDYFNKEQEQIRAA